MRLLEVEEFERCRGDVFSLVVDSSRVDITLTAAERLGHARPGARTPFSLLFRGPKTPLLPQGTYRFLHPRFEELEIFVVPIGPDAEGMQYEAIFT